MGLSRRRDSSMIWPGFVDAVTTLLMVLMFVLTIFTVMQSVLRETITTQDTQLNALTEQVAGLADALGLERQKAQALQAEVGTLGQSLAAAQAEGARQTALIATLTGQLATRDGELAAARAEGTRLGERIDALGAELAARQADLAAAGQRITGFEAQVAGLLAERDAARGEAAARAASLAELDAAQKKLISEQEALQLALAQARSEIDAGAEAARLAAARREALDALVADLQARNAAAQADLARTAGSLDATQAQLADREAALAARQAELDAAKTRLSDEEAARLVDKAAADALREKLQSSDSELTAMTLALEEQRRKAEETLTLLAAAQTEAARAAQLGDARASLVDTANKALAAERAKSAEAQRQVALLNTQIATLRGQLGALQDVLDASAARDSTSRVQLEALGNQLNSALAQVAAEQRRRAELEEAERKRLAAEAQNLERYRSEFFGQLREVLAGRQGVRIVGDRFVFSSEVLFNPGSADLSDEGKAQIAGVVATLREVAVDIPDSIDWIIRVDGHTDNVPLSGQGEFRDNWELSQARALSVVRFMQDDLGFPPQRMAATGFGEYRPVAEGDSEAARAQNRRIELKLTER